MNPERWAEIQRLFNGAIALPVAQHVSYLRSACSDEAIAQEVLKLIASRPSNDFLVPPRLTEASTGNELGEFVLLDEIGRGAMGVVYKARQKSLGRTVAVKVLPANLTLTQREIDRFQREARAAARLRHPGVVSIHTVGEEKGTHYFAMEFVEGRNLAEELKRLRGDLGAKGDESPMLPPTHEADYFATVADIVRQAADALYSAHESGIVHRDVKPSNILLDAKRRVKLVDFGLARDEEQGSLSKTREGEGTLHYMSPEQARSQNRQIDHRTDIYSLGVVLFELLTLSRPFEGTTSREIMDGICEKDPPRIRRLNKRVPRDLEIICLKAMSKKPRDRYRNAAELRDDLRRFLAHEAITAQPPSIGELARRKAYRHRVALGMGGVGIGALLLGMGLVSSNLDRGRLSDLESEIRSSLQQASLGSLPPSRILQLREFARECRTLRPRGEVQAATGEDPVLLLEEAVEALRRQILQTCRADFDLAKDLSRPEGVRQFHFLRGLQTVIHGAYLFPEDEALTQLAAIESVYPTISVDATDEAGNPIPAHVFLRTIDAFTTGVEASVPLGATPLPPTPVPPGYYRVVVVFDSGGFRELVCNPGPALSHIDLVARRRADELAITNGMVRFDATTYVFPPEPVGTWALVSQSVALAPFLLDETEVSNAEYHGFVAATGHAPPSYWKLVQDMDDFLAQYGDYPVVGVGWDDAVAYAEWCGKRLPTAAEWMLAAGGLENRPYPYVPNTPEDVRGNVHAPFEVALTEDVGWQQYLTHSAPVRSHPDARTPEGIFHMFGNVQEFTESMMVEPFGGQPLVRPFDRLSLGSQWTAVAIGQTMQAPEYWGMGGNLYNSKHLGFRCAKSTEP